MNLFPCKKESEPKCIVRVRTSCYVTSGKLCKSKEVYTLKRKTEIDWFNEELNMLGGELWERILDLDLIEDGLYILQACNFSKDYETGVIDDYDLKLVPYEGDSL